jgi:protein SHQ1
MDYAAEQDLLRRLMSGEELRPEELAAPRPRQATEARYYGFNQGYSGYLLRLQEPLREVVELPDPEFTPAEARRAVREALEEAKFDPEHYMHDFADPEREIEALLQLEPHWLPTGEREFSEDELTTLRWLPARSYALMSGEAARRATLGLLELVFAYAHEWRLQHGEPGVESAVSLCRLSAQLSCLDESQLESPRELVRTCMRRALAYPLYRHWGLACRALEDARLLLARGRRALLRALLQIKHALEFSQAGVRHLVPLYLEDYCVWLQAGCTDAMLDWLQAELARPQNQPDKQAVGWPLERLERQVIEDLTRDDLEEESLLEEESAAPLPL